MPASKKKLPRRRRIGRSNSCTSKRKRPNGKRQGTIYSWVTHRTTLYWGRKPALSAGPEPNFCLLRQPIQPIQPLHQHHRDVVASLQACKLAQGALASTSQEELREPPRTAQQQPPAAELGCSAQSPTSPNGKRTKAHCTTNLPTKDGLETSDPTQWFH